MRPKLPMEELNHDLPNRRVFTIGFFGSPILVTLTASATAVTEWLHQTLRFCRNFNLLGHLVVGVAVQWKPSNYHADTLQLCVGNRCLIYQLALTDTVPQRLRDFLLHKGNSFVGIANVHDKDKLRYSRHRLEIGRLFDMRRHIRYGEGINSAPVEWIVQKFLGHEGVFWEGDVTFSDWSKENLNNDQIRQAAVDASVSFQIGKKFGAWRLKDPIDMDTAG